MLRICYNILFVNYGKLFFMKNYLKANLFELVIAKLIVRLRPIHINLKKKIVRK